MSATKWALTRKHPHLPGKFHGLMVSRLSVIFWNQGFDSFTDFMVSRVSLNIGAWFHGLRSFADQVVFWFPWFIGFMGFKVAMLGFAVSRASGFHVFMSPKFSSVIHPPFPMHTSSKSEFFFPKVLIWSPQEHFGMPMKCPVHGNKLLPLKWTNTLSGVRDHHARLVHDIQGNIILVQRIYYCVCGWICHSLRSTSLDVDLRLLAL